MKKTLLLLFLLTAYCLLPTAARAQGTPGTVRCLSQQVDTLDSLFRINDQPHTALTSALTSSSTTIPVGTTGPFPSSGSIKINDEVIYYSSKTSNSFGTLVRGAGGTIAAAHTNGTLVNAPILGVHHNTLAQAVICAQQYALAAMPLSYLDTDNTLAANSDTKVPSQKAVKSYVDASGSGTFVPVTRTVNGHALS